MLAQRGLLVMGVTYVPVQILVYTVQIIIVKWLQHAPIRESYIIWDHVLMPLTDVIPVCVWNTVWHVLKWLVLNRQLVRATTTE